MKQTRLKQLSQTIWQPPPLHPVSYQPPTHRRLLAFPVCAFIIEEFEGFLDVRNIVSHLHVHTREHSVNLHNLVAWISKRVIILPPYHVICLVRWIMDRLGEVGREVVKKAWLSLIIKLYTDNQAFSSLIIKTFDNQTVSSPWLSRISDTCKNQNEWMKSFNSHL